MAVVRVKERFQVTLPNEVRRGAGIRVGDYLEARTGAKGVITLTPKSLVDRAIAEGLADVKAGRTCGPFDTAAEMAASIESKLKGTRAAKRGQRR